MWTAAYMSWWWILVICQLAQASWETTTPTTTEPTTRPFTPTMTTTSTRFTMTTATTTRTTKPTTASATTTMPITTLTTTTTTTPTTTTKTSRSTSIIPKTTTTTPTTDTTTMPSTPMMTTTSTRFTMTTATTTKTATKPTTASITTTIPITRLTTATTTTPTITTTKTRPTTTTRETTTTKPTTTSTTITRPTTTTTETTSPTNTTTKTTSKPTSTNSASYEESTVVMALEPRETPSVTGPTDQPYATDLGVRLVGGRNLAEGRLEVYHNGHWGTVCDDNFDVNDAVVVCRALQLDSEVIPEVFPEAHYGEGTHMPVWLDDVMCTGSEVSLDQCRHNGWWDHDCTHSEDVGVVCTQGPLVRLSNGSSAAEGRVEVYSPRGWGTVCDNDFDIRDARVVCAMLGLNIANPIVRTEAFFGQGNGVILMADLDCNGSEVSVHDCPLKLHAEHSCTHKQDVGVVCPEAATVRLVNGSSDWEGRLEVFHGYTWGTVCDDGFGVGEAAVVCRMLGLDSSEPVVHHNAAYGPGSGPILLDEVKCLGAERNISLCYHAPWRQTDCSHDEDVGISCPAVRKIHLVNGSTEYEGRVELYVDGQWGTVCEEDFDWQDALVVCRMMGVELDSKPTSVVVYGGARFGVGSGHVLLTNLECQGHESDLQRCRHKAASSVSCPHDRDVGVTCGDDQTPLIG